MRVSISYVAQMPLKEPLYWFEISIFDNYGQNKLREPLQLKLGNVKFGYKSHDMTSKSIVYVYVFEKDEYFMPKFNKGDSIEFSLRLAYPGWFKYFTHIQMSVFYVL